MVTGTISIALVISISMGIGWVLTLFLPFSLFENTLLSMFACLTAWIIWNQLFNTAATYIPRNEEEDWDDDNEEDDDEDEDWDHEEEIPQSRFWQTPAERTWENWFRYVIANAVYDRLMYLRGSRNEDRRQELSIHLSDAAIRALKANPPNARRMSLSRNRLKQEMLKKGQHPPENPIIVAAASAINIEFMHMEEDLRKVAKNHLWEKLADTEM